jgi:hypothetical protein
MLDRLLHALLAVGAAILAIVLAALAWLEAGLGHLMAAAHVPPDLRFVLAVVVAVLFLLAAVRLFGGFIRLILIVLLVAFVVHALSHHGGFEPHKPAAIHA